MSGPRIEEWTEAHPRWPDVAALLEAAGQMSWVAGVPSPLHLVALVGGEPVGFLTFIVREIGPADNCPPLGLTEAKVVAFGVREDARRRGIGSALQRRLLERAGALGCYQVRSRSDVGHEENHRLKLRLGFAVSPHVRTLEGGEERPGFFFVKVVEAED
jgi:GNAT superfamily N-acetyltransferase